MPCSSKPCVSTRTCRFLPLAACRHRSRGCRCEPPFFSAFHTLTVDDAGRGAGFARGFLAALEVERMMDAIQRAVPVPQAEVIMHGASGRQILGQRAPLAAGAQNVITPLITSRIATRRLPPPGLPDGISGSICAHSASVRSLDNAVCRGCSAGGCRQSTRGTSRCKFTTPENRDSALQEGPPDNRFIRLIKSPDGHSGKLSGCQRGYRKTVRLVLPRKGPKRSARRSPGWSIASMPVKHLCRPRFMPRSICQAAGYPVNGGAKLVHPGGAKLVHLMLCGTRCWGVVPVVHRRDPRCFV